MVRAGERFHAIRGRKALAWDFGGYQEPVGFGELLRHPMVLVTPRRWVRRLFEGLILLGAVLTGIAAWFLMGWWLLGAMVVATLAQLIRLALRLR